MNGVGSSAVNAVSEDYILMSRITPLNWDKSTKEVYDLWNEAGPRSKRDLFYVVWYKKGYKYYEGALKFYRNCLGMSTIVLFRPDPEIYEPAVIKKMAVPIQNLQYFLLILEKFYKRRATINVEGTELTGSGFIGYGFEFMKRIIDYTYPDMVLTKIKEQESKSNERNNNLTSIITSKINIKNHLKFNSQLSFGLKKSFKISLNSFSRVGSPPTKETLTSFAK